MYNVFTFQCPAKNVLQKSTHHPIIFDSHQQDSLLQLLSPALQSAFEGQKSEWIHSQNASVAAIDASDLESLKVAVFCVFVVLMVGG